MRGSAVVILLALWGCGDDNGSHPPDAPHGSDDGGTPDAPITTQPVTITVTDGADPVANVAVYFQKADSSLVAMKLTDATGTASQVMDAGGYVTAVDAFRNNELRRRPGRPADHDLHTWAGVKPGDHLVLPRADFFSTNVDVTVPAFTGALAYLVHYSGSDPDPLDDAPALIQQSGVVTTTISLYGNHTMADFLVSAEDGTQEQYVYAANQSTAAAVDLSALQYTPMTDVTFSVTGLPADLTSAYGDNYLVAPHGLVWQAQSSNDVSSGAVTLTLHRPTPAVTSVLQLDVTDPTEVANSYIVDWKPAAAATTIDATSRRLKVYGTAPAFAQASHSVTWTEGATGADGDAAIVQMEGSRAVGQTYWNWELVTAHTATGAVFPVLPTGADQYNALADDSTSLQSVRVVKLPGGYDALRAVSLGGSLATLVTSATGQLAYSQWPWVNPNPVTRTSPPLSPVGQFLKKAFRPPQR
jgi:hypothetical protein